MFSLAAILRVGFLAYALFVFYFGVVASINEYRVLEADFVRSASAEYKNNNPGQRVSKHQVDGWYADYRSKNSKDAYILKSLSNKSFILSLGVFASVLLVVHQMYILYLLVISPFVWFSFSSFALFGNVDSGLVFWPVLSWGLAGVLGYLYVRYSKNWHGA